MSKDLVEGLLEIDRDANQLLGAIGSPGYGLRRETISAALGRKLVNGTATAKEQGLCQLLDQVLGENHCLEAYARTYDEPRVRKKRRRARRSEEDEINDVADVLRGH